MVFTTERFLEVAIKNWPEWDLNPGLLNSDQAFHEFNYEPEQTLKSYSNFSFCSVSDFIFAHCLCKSPGLFNRSFVEVINNIFRLQIF